MKVKIENLDYFGRGIASLPKKTFIRNALPDEEVEITITKEHKTYDEGITTKIIKPNSKRIESICPYFPDCGGCDLRNLFYPDTVSYKLENVKSILKDYINEDTLINLYKSKNYGRNKITLKVQNKKIGFYKKGTHDLIEINKCLNVKDSINKVLPYLKELNIINGEILIRSNYVDKLLISIKSKDRVKFEILQTLPYIEGIIINNKTVYKNNYFIDKIDNYLFKVSYNSFFQVNSYINGKIFNILKSELDRDKNVLDLCSGVGTLSILASDYSKKVYAIEINESNYLDSLENKKLNKTKNIDFILGDAFKLISTIDDKIDAIIIDPPRSGISKKGIQSILNYAPEKIIYISCNPITLKRDLSYLSKQYKLDKLYILDMFTYAYHIESITILERRLGDNMTTEYIDFPMEEHENLLKRINNNQIIYTTRVSNEVGKYFIDFVYNSPFGKLKVIYFEHFTNIYEHPFLNELNEIQIIEINKHINEKGFDLIGLISI